MLILQIFLCLIANCYEGIIMIILLFNRNLSSPSNSPNSFFWCSFDAHSSSFSYQGCLISFSFFLFAMPSYGRISTIFNILGHLWFNHFYICIVKQLKIVEIPTSQNMGLCNPKCGWHHDIRGDYLAPQWVLELLSFCKKLVIDREKVKEKKIKIFQWKLFPTTITHTSKLQSLRLVGSWERQPYASL